MPKISNDRLLERRAHILQGCIRCFSRKGFHQASMRDICDELQMSPGGLYRYFRSKDEIIVTMIELDRIQWQEAFAGLSVEQSFHESLAALTRFAEEVEMTDPLVGRVWIQIYAEATTNPVVAPVMAEHYRVMSLHLEALIKRAQERGEVCPSLQPPALGAFLMSAFDGLLLRLPVDPSADVEAMQQSFLDFIQRLTQPRKEVVQ
jgi:AcrR family transcriptional regulator